MWAQLGLTAVFTETKNLLISQKVCLLFLNTNNLMVWQMLMLLAYKVTPISADNIKVHFSIYRL